MKLTKETPNIEWLRLPPGQLRVLLTAWSADSIVCSGRALNAASSLTRRELLKFIAPIDGGLRGEFELTDVAKDYPPTGLKSLLVKHDGKVNVGSKPAGRSALTQEGER